MGLSLTWWPKDTEMDTNENVSGIFHAPEKLQFSLESVFDFLRENVGSFADQWDKQILAENPVTDALCRYLNDVLGDEDPKRNLRFFFHHQSEETDDGRSKKNDFEAVPLTPKGSKLVKPPGALVPIVRFEAKRLDSRLESAREKEYVRGEYSSRKRPSNSGGIERFKNKSHGSKERNGALIAYIQTDDTPMWLAKINQWIDAEIAHPSDPNLSWGTQDKLTNHQAFSDHDEFKSTSARPDLAPINLHHFWIPLNQNYIRNPEA